MLSANSRLYKIINWFLERFDDFIELTNIRNTTQSHNII